MKANSIANQKQTMHMFIRVLLCINAGVVSAWVPYAPRISRNNKAVLPTAMHLSKTPLDEENVEGDWRDFRAQLVRQETSTNRNDGEHDEEHWAYETGDFVERGSIVVSVPSSCSFLDDVDSLNSICYRKSIVLVLDTSTNFIQGIILNRPTNIGVKEGADGMQFVRPGHGEIFENEIGLGGGTHNPPHRWKIWFGGEVNGPYSDCPQVMCLHSVMTDMAKSVSDVVIPGIYMTSFEGAQNIVIAGDANPSDFWIFCGICGWETNTFYREMHEEGLWHIVSADSAIILEELNLLRCEEEEEENENCDIDADPKNAGLHTWEMLMEKIGRSDEAHDRSHRFGDLLLHEWATGALSFEFADERRGELTETITQVGLDDDGSFLDLGNYDPAYDMTIRHESREPTMVGTMIRGSSAQRSPFLLSDQGYHKSLILILRDGEDRSEGVILNHVTSNKVSFDLENGESVELNLRYGGPTLTYEDDDGNYGVPTFYLHSNDAIRDAGVGFPIGNSGLYKMTKKEVIKSLGSGIASSDDVFVIQGCSVWNKRGDHSGVVGEIEDEYFEVVPRSQIKTVWSVLSEQKVLSQDSLDYNMMKGRQAWIIAKGGGAMEMSKNNDNDALQVVFGSDISVASLADEAARRWVNVNLLAE
jgi:putative AlgH/UPF0301 family transcriptional regulator